MQDTKRTMRVAFVGEAMAELMLGGDHDDQPPSLGFAGDTMNTAIYLNRLMGESADVSYVTVLGQDPLSQRLITRFEEESIDTQSIARSSERLVGLYAITTDQAGERTFSYWRSESAARTLFQDGEQTNFDVLAGFNVIVLSAISLAILPAKVRCDLLGELARLRETEQVTVVFDSNYRPALWESVEVAQETTAAAWRITDIALPSIDDEQMLFNDKDEASLVARLRSYGVTRGALKRGETGPVSLTETPDKDAMQNVDLSEAVVDVVDTTAAGDSFNAGYLSAILLGNDEQFALQAGHACALRVIAHRGAIIPKEQW